MVADLLRDKALKQERCSCSPHAPGHGMLEILVFAPPVFVKPHPIILSGQWTFVGINNLRLVLGIDGGPSQGVQRFILS